MNRMALVAVLLLACSAAWGQQNVPEIENEPADPQVELDSRIDNALAELDALDRNTQRNLENARSSSQATLSAYNKWVLSYRQDAYLWHHNSTIAIFVVVVIVVLSGIVLAAWQLQAWISRVNAYDKVFLKRLKSGEAIDGDLVQGIGNAESNEVNVKGTDVVVSSAYVGVVILGLSMGFFLAYLLYVYPVTQGP